MSTITEKQATYLTQLRNARHTELTKPGAVALLGLGLSWSAVVPAWGTMSRDAQDDLREAFGPALAARFLLTDEQIAALDKDDASHYIQDYERAGEMGPFKLVLIHHLFRALAAGQSWDDAHGPEGIVQSRLWQQDLVLRYYQREADEMGS